MLLPSLFCFFYVEEVFSLEADKMGGDSVFVCALWYMYTEKNRDRKTQLCVIINRNCCCIFALVEIDCVKFLLPLKLPHSHQLIVRNCAGADKDLCVNKDVEFKLFKRPLPLIFGAGSKYGPSWTKRDDCSCREYYTDHSETGIMSSQSAVPKHMLKTKTIHELCTQNGREMAR